MKRSIVGPWRFVCGEGVLRDIGHHAAALGKKAFGRRQMRRNLTQPNREQLLLLYGYAGGAWLLVVLLAMGSAAPGAHADG